jgi:hypothetical protein
VRYGTSLSSRELELVILLTGARYESDAEFDIHVDEARRAGVGWDVIRSIPGGMLLPPSVEEEDDEEENDDGFSLERVKERVIPALMREHDGVMLPEIGTTCEEAREREVAIVLFASEFLDTITVCDKTYNATRDRLHGIRRWLKSWRSWGIAHSYRVTLKLYFYTGEASVCHKNYADTVWGKR